jgi:nucleolar protein 53
LGELYLDSFEIWATHRAHISLDTAKMPPSSKTKTAPSQASQPSRKGKKAWRKHVDITPITSGLDARREEIITHGRPLSEKTQDELFALDTSGASKEDVSKNSQGKKIKVLKMDEILGRRSAVPALENSRKRPAEVGDGVLPQKKQKVDWVSKKELARLRNNLDKPSHLEVENIDNNVPEVDLWDVSEVVVPDGTVEKSKQDEYIPKPRAKVAPATLSRPPIALTKTGTPTQSVPAPNAGHSYNPAYEDWDALLTQAGNEELASEQQRLLAAKVAAEKQARINALAAQPERDPGADDPESEWEGFETDHDDAVALTEAEMKRRKRPERKTPAQRNKINRRRAAEQLAKHEARMRQRGEEVIKSLISQHQKQEDSTVAEPTSTDTTSTSTSTPFLRRKPTLGPSKATLPPQPLELVLPDELQDSLRRLKPEGNLLTDRFRNLLVNGKLEARKRVTYAASRKKQVKMTEKWWSKDFQIGA